MLGLSTIVSTHDYSAPCNRTKPTDGPGRTAQSRSFPLVTYSPLKPHNPIPALIGPALTHPRSDWSALAAVTGGVTYI